MPPLTDEETPVTETPRAEKRIAALCTDVSEGLHCSLNLPVSAQLPDSPSPPWVQHGSREPLGAVHLVLPAGGKVDIFPFSAMELVTSPVGRELGLRPSRLSSPSPTSTPLSSPRPPLHVILGNILF